MQIVAHPVACPECPVAQRFFGQGFQLVPEIAGHKIDDAPVARRGIVLLEYLQHHHPRPPVGRVVAL